MDKREIEARVAKVQEYFEGVGDDIHRLVWGDDFHLGFPPDESSTLPEAMKHSNALMAQAVNLEPETRVLDLGCGYGSTARFLAAKYRSRVTGITISRPEVEEAQKRAKESELDDLLTFEYGDFHQLKYGGMSFDVVWSQDSLMYGADKPRILGESHRVLVPEGHLVFTDILVSQDAPEEVKTLLYSRVNTPEMWDIERYREALGELDFEVVRVEDWSQYVARSYAWVRDQVWSKRSELGERIGDALVSRTADSLQFWVDQANAGNVGWAFFVARKPG